MNARRRLCTLVLAAAAFAIGFASTRALDLSGRENFDPVPAEIHGSSSTQANPAISALPSARPQSSDNPALPASVLRKVGVPPLSESGGVTVAFREVFGLSPQQANAIEAAFKRAKADRFGLQKQHLRFVAHSTDGIRMEVPRDLEEERKVFSQLAATIRSVAPPAAFDYLERAGRFQPPSHPHGRFYDIEHKSGGWVVYRSGFLADGKEWAVSQTRVRELPDEFEQLLAAAELKGEP